MINKVKELRAVVPVPMSEAMQLLKENGGDVEKCVYLYKARSIRHICEQTGCDEAMANKYFESEKYDINRAVSFIREELFDRCFVPVEGVTADKLHAALQWIYLVEDKDFAYSLSFARLSEVVDVMSRIASLKDTAIMLQEVKELYDRIFEGYSDSLPIEDFVRRHRQLDDEEAFVHAARLIPLRLIVIKEEILRFKRNM